tara:strand:+ start:9340 stop:9549 length:210 start_codon:yes stop_codon:yes gene_type:complete
MDIRKRFGARVRALREEKGWSQEELADRSGLHRTYISSVERGIRNPTITVVEQIAAALTFSMSELVANI